MKKTGRCEIYMYLVFILLKRSGILKHCSRLLHFFDKNTFAQKTIAVFFDQRIYCADENITVSLEGMKLHFYLTLIVYIKKYL